MPNPAEIHLLWTMQEKPKIEHRNATTEKNRVIDIGISGYRKKQAPLAITSLQISDREREIWQDVIQIKTSQATTEVVSFQFQQDSSLEALVGLPIIRCPDSPMPYLHSINLAFTIR